MAETCSGRVSEFEDDDGRIAFPMRCPRPSPMASAPAGFGDGLVHAYGRYGPRQAGPTCVASICAKAEERIVPDEPRARPVSDVEPSFVCCSHG